jgi:hypothetical protein
MTNDDFRVHVNDTTRVEMTCLWGAENRTWGWQNISLPVTTYTYVA